MINIQPRDRTVHIAVAIFSLLCAFKFVYISGGNILNHNPYIFPDAYDWYAEGVYVWNRLFYSDLPILNILRPPLFVLVCTADYLLGEKGIFLGIVIGLCFYFTYYLLYKILYLIQMQKTEYSWFSVPLAIASTVYPLNFSRVYLLPDNLAITITIASIYFIYQYQLSKQSKYIYYAIVAGSMASLTQLYGGIPIIIFCIVKSLEYLLNDKSTYKQYIYVALSVIGLNILITILWRLLIPHFETPKNFGLIQFNTQMANFYINAWTLYLAPPLLAIFLFRFFKLQAIKSYSQFIFLLITISFFLSMSFFYQWHEARFSYYVWPWLLLIAFQSIEPKKFYGAIAFSIILLLALPLTPSNYWVPNLKEVKFSLSTNWFSAYLISKPTDRNLNQFEFSDLSDSILLQTYGPYIGKSLQTYYYLKHLKKN